LATGLVMTGCEITITNEEKLVIHTVTRSQLGSPKIKSRTSYIVRLLLTLHVYD